MRKKTKITILKCLVNVCRLLLAVTLIFSGFVKANDPLGMVYKLEEYVNSVSWLTLPETFLLGCAVILAVLEFILGVYILFGISTPKTSRITVAFMTAMTLVTVYIVIANPVSDCGCFGDVIKLSNWETLGKNIVLLAMAIVCERYKSLQLNFSMPSVKWFISLVSLCFIIGYTVYCIVCLPVIDFIPYKEGVSLQSNGNGTDEQYDIKIIYERNGETLELTVEDDDPDTTWHYVETRRTMLTNADASTTDFYVSDMNDEDITEDITFADGYTFLLIIPNLLYADEGCVDRVNDIYDYAKEENIGFYCLTASADERSQAYWSEHTGAEYTYSIADESMLKSIVRGKPGLMLLRNGTIVKKWSNYNMPNGEDMAEKYSYLFE